MSRFTMIVAIKKIHKDAVVLFKIKDFYHAYGRDAYILSYLFGYKLKSEEKVSASVGFHLNAIFKVRSKLEELKVNYMLIDSRNNYEVDVGENYRNFNDYQEVFERAYTRVKRKKKINNIVEELNMFVDRDDFKEIIRRIEDTIDEAREI